MKLYNTSSKTLEEFKPQNPDEIKIYTCGPTVYSAPHIGNYSAYIYWDLLLRTLIANGFSPKRVLNLTDVGHLTSDGDTGEDKLEKGAKREGKTVWEVADYYIDLFKSGFKELNLLEPYKWARATDYIDESEKLVARLIENDFTYETSDGVYFDTSKFSAYSNFAHLDLDHQKAGARVAFSSEKRNVSDFAVWKFIKDDEDHAMRWDFLGRPGYPGWHLECSSIIHAELGEPIDIHTGGIDHIPVHHTNEIAQTYGAFNSRLANTWLHCNFITINGEKISKSLGNIITLKDLDEKGYSAHDFKLWLYQGHYRKERNFTWEDLESARIRRLKWINFVLKTRQDNAVNAPRTPEFKGKLVEYLNNDLNSAEAFAYIDQVANSLTYLDWSDVSELFGLDLRLGENDVPSSKDYSLVEARSKAREEKNWAEADRIRDELASNNLTVLDTPEGPLLQFLR